MVFECEVEPAQWAEFRKRLILEINADKERLRFYRLGADGQKRIDHVGAKVPLDLDGPLIF